LVGWSCVIECPRRFEPDRLAPHMRGCKGATHKRERSMPVFLAGKKPASPATPTKKIDEHKRSQSMLPSMTALSAAGVIGNNDQKRNSGTLSALIPSLTKKPSITTSGNTSGGNSPVTTAPTLSKVASLTRKTLTPSSSASSIIPPLSRPSSRQITGAPSKTAATGASPGTGSRSGSGDWTRTSIPKFGEGSGGSTPTTTSGPSLRPSASTLSIERRDAEDEERQAAATKIQRMFRNSRAKSMGAGIQRMVTCYCCGRQFSTASLPKHLRKH
jgi:hypothetical protein